MSRSSDLADHPVLGILDNESNGIKFVMEAPKRRDGRIIVHFVR